jgi:hypothetical protein
MCFKGLYAFIGRLTPREEKLAENLRLEKKKNAKLMSKSKMQILGYRWKWRELLKQSMQRMSLPTS